MTMTAPDEDTRHEAGFEVDVTPSGHPQVDTVLDRLSDLADRPLAGHAEVYDDVHQRLRGILAEPTGSSGPGGPAGPTGSAGSAGPAAFSGHR